jgi:pyruvate dehydrogenase E1 component alpha subunit
MMNNQQLIDFETDIGNLFNQAKIAAPIHLSSGNEDKIRQVFKFIDIETDWVCCTWRNHYQALLKGIPPEVLKDRIIKGKSMIMNLPEYKFICSSIVGGIPSIATGIALASKLKGTNEKVWCWTGDMSAETGAWAEAYKYSVAQDLPITFIVEDNELSVLTPTEEVWGKDKWYLPEQNVDKFVSKHLIYYKYKNEKYPHAGAGVRVQF